MTGSHIALFAGVDMTGLAVEAASFNTIATAEVDPWNRKVLAARQPDAWHFNDVRQVRPEHFKGALAIQRPLLISGGFPCQDISPAGTGLGLDGARSGLWSEFARIIEQFQPEYVLIENSTMLRHRGGNVVLADLARMGYDARWDCIPAAAVGAPHLRDRMFIAAARQDVGLPHGPAITEADRIEGGIPAKLPRAGVSFETGGVYELKPSATIKDAKKACLAHPVSCPATPTGAWPTPAASNPQDGESPESWLARREKLKAKHSNGNGAGMPLNIAVRLFPTPTKSDGSGGPGTTPKRTGGPNLRTVVAAEDGNGRLNPEWVEWMMGLPLGWTDPDKTNAELTAHPGWGAEPTGRTVPDRAVKDRAKRIRALGNGLVPQAAAVALTWITPED